MGRARRRWTTSLQMGSKENLGGIFSAFLTEDIPDSFFKSDEQEREKTSPLKAILKQQMAEKAATLAGTGAKEEASPVLLEAKEEPTLDASAQNTTSPDKSAAV